MTPHEQKFRLVLWVCLKSGVRAGDIPYMILRFANEMTYREIANHQDIKTHQYIPFRINRAIKRIRSAQTREEIKSFLRSRAAW